MAEMKISNTLVNDTNTGVVAYAEQLKDAKVNYSKYSKLTNEIVERFGLDTKFQDKLNDFFLYHYDEFHRFLEDPGLDDSIIDSWKEIQDFLNGLPDDETMWLKNKLQQLDNRITAMDIPDGGAYDVSADHVDGGGVYAEYATLANALAAIDVSDRKSGMTIRFINSVSHKYEQWRYLNEYKNTTAGNAAFVNVANWTKGNSDGIYDVSVENAVNGTPATYETLALALAAIPAHQRVPGMSIKFIQTTPATYNVVKTEGVTELPTGTELDSASSIGSGTYTASQLSDFSTLPTTSAVTYYVAVTEDETTTYTTWVITLAQSSDNKYVQYLYNGTSTAVADFTNVANWEKTNLEGELLDLEKETLGNIYIEEWYRGNINANTGKYGSNNIRVTNSIPISTNVRIICTGDVLCHAYVKYKSTASPIDGGTPNTDFVVTILPSSGSRTDVTIEADLSFPDLYITFVRASDTSQNITPEEVAANVKITYLDADNVKIKNSISTLSGRVTATETVLSDKKSIPIQDSTDLMTSGGVEATLFHQYATKDIAVAASGQQHIMLREFDYGQKLAIRILSNTSVFETNGRVVAEIRTSNNVVKTYRLNNEWTIIETAADNLFNRVYLYVEGEVTTAGTVKCEVIFKDAFDCIIRDNLPEPVSEHNIISKSVYPFAKEVIKNKAGKNLCNPLSPRFILNAFLSSGKEIYNITQSLVGITDYISVSENGLVINHPINTGGNTYAVYDSNYNYIRSVSNNAVYTYVQGDAYVRFQFNYQYRNEVQVEKGTIVTEFEEYNGIKGYFDDFSKAFEYDFLKNTTYDSSGTYSRGVKRLFTNLNIKQGDWFKVKIVSSSQTTNPVVYIGVNNNINQRLVNYPVIGTDYLFKLGTTPTVHIIDTTVTEIDIYVDAVSGGDPIDIETELVVYNKNIDSDELSDSNDKVPTSHVVKQAIDDAVADVVPEDILVMPSVTYALKGTENSIYHKNYLKYEHPDFFVAPHNAFNSNKGWNFTDRYFRTTNPTNPNLLIDIRNTKTCEIMKSITANVTMGDPATNNGAKVVNVIGDSFTAGGYWFKIIYDTCPSLSFVGMRYPRVSEQSHEVKCEGRLGWRLNKYFQPHDDVTPTHIQPFSPFLHPNGYTYYGVIDFWKVIVNGTSQYEMGTFGFDEYSSWFNTNGYKVNPSQNDLMYDGVNDKYVYWNGSAWVDFSGTPTFVFNYAKYLSTWNITTPDFVLIMLGKNDFQANVSNEAFATWKSQMDTLIASVHAVDSSITIGICTPTTANEAAMNSDSNASQVGGRNMWLARKWMIETFDVAEYKDLNVFIVDTGVCLDPEYGFLLSEIKPFEFYTGNRRELYATNGVHPSNDGYKQIGVPAAGFIQAKR